MADYDPASRIPIQYFRHSEAEKILLLRGPTAFNPLF
jgi:hypothetical protein